MKKQMIMFIAVLIAGTTITFAQGGGNFQRRTVEERVAAVHQKLDSAFKMEAKTQGTVDSVFAAYYRSTDRVREEAMSGGGQPDRQAMMEKMKPLTDARDKELKDLMGDVNFKKFKDEIEPAMRPQRGGPGGGGRPGGN